MTCATRMRSASTARPRMTVASGASEPRTPTRDRGEDERDEPERGTGEHCERDAESRSANRAFFNSIRSRKPAAPGFADALAAHATVEAAYRSARSKQVALVAAPTGRAWVPFWDGEYRTRESRYRDRAKRCRSGNSGVVGGSGGRGGGGGGGSRTRVSRAVGGTSPSAAVGRCHLPTGQRHPVGRPSSFRCPGEPRGLTYR
jgi:hypothetical protein